MQEIWFDIPKYEGLYQYSNTLKVRSVDHFANSKNGNIKLMRGRILKPVLSEGTYACITLSKLGVKEVIQLHKFFAEKFIPNPENKKYVNHKNGNKHDYRLLNLEWATKSEDLQHAYDTGL